MIVKGCLQEAFETWGLPKMIRVDNGMPWGTSHPSPSAMALWLAGLEVVMLYGRPAQSTDNAIVERSHGILNKWVIPATCTDLDELQDKLDWASFTHRERYRSAHHVTRAEAYPHLYDNPRRYRCSTDAQQWQLESVASYLSRYCFERKVEKYGQISLFAHTYSVGRDYAHQIVTVTLDQLTHQWVIYDEQAHEIKRHYSKELNYALLATLQLTKRRKST